jgi:hypothetical protein
MEEFVKALTEKLPPWLTATLAVCAFVILCMSQARDYVPLFSRQDRLLRRKKKELEFLRVCRKLEAEKQRLDGRNDKWALSANAPMVFAVAPPAPGAPIFDRTPVEAAPPDQGPPPKEKQPSFLATLKSPYRNVVLFVVGCVATVAGLFFLLFAFISIFQSSALSFGAISIDLIAFMGLYGAFRLLTWAMRESAKKQPRSPLNVGRTPADDPRPQA